MKIFSGEKSVLGSVAKTLRHISGMKPTLRIYWDYVHTTLRYEDLLHLLQCGFEVIPRRPLPDDLRVDADYEDARGKHYIPWQNCCTLPANLAEQIRRLRLADAANFTPADWELLNAHVDCLFVQLAPKALACVAANYRGTILQRIFGYHDKSYSQYCRDEGIDPSAFPSNVYYSPNLPMLAALEESPFKDRCLALPTTCSASRMTYRWLGQFSEPFATMVISHLRSGLMRDIFQTFRPLADIVPVRVLGMNTVDPGDSQMDVIGSLGWDDYLSYLCRGRVHIETGINPHHMRFSPLEATLCGIPVLFRTDGGFARFLKCRGIPYNKQREMGAFPNVELIGRFLNQQVDNIARLQRMADSLRETLEQLDIVGEFRQGCAELAAKHRFECKPTKIPLWLDAPQDFIPPLPGAMRQREVDEIFEFDTDLAQEDQTQHAWITKEPQPKQVAIAKGVINRPFHGRLHLQLVDDEGRNIPSEVCWVAIGVREESGPTFGRRSGLQRIIEAPKGFLMRLMWNGKDTARICRVMATRSA